MTLKDFKNLELSGPNSAGLQFLAEAKARLPSHWQRREDLEARVGTENMTCFSCAEGPGRPSSALWLAQREPDRIYVSNIVPLSKSKLSYDEYNAVLDDFRTAVAEPASLAAGMQLRVTSGELRLEELLRPGTFESLRSFSQGANRSTGSAHPYDKQRWFDFVTRTHRENAPLSAHDLERWLRADGWDEDHAVELIIEYERARDLLRFYDDSK